MSAIFDGAGAAAITYSVCKFFQHQERIATLTSLAGISGFLISRAAFGLQRELFPLEKWINDAEKEEALEPERRMVDPHHHLWDPARQPKFSSNLMLMSLVYKIKPSLLLSTLAFLSKMLLPSLVHTFSHFLPVFVPFMVKQMMLDINNMPQGYNGDSSAKTSCHNILATVYIECGWQDKSVSKAMEATGEAYMAQKIAETTNNRFCTGIVAHIPLIEGREACKPAFDALARCPNVRGIRNAFAHTSNKYILSPYPKNDRLSSHESFREAFGLLKEYNMSFDCWLYEDNIEELKDLADHFPDIPIICDHVGLPIGLPSGEGIEEENFKSWKERIKNLSSSKNVYCKLSGLGMPVPGFKFDTRKRPANSKELSEAWKPYILHCIQCFGVDRCMFASNFPMDKVSCTYTSLFNAFKIIVQNFTEEEKDKLFYSNAVNLYRLEVSSK